MKKGRILAVTGTIGVGLLLALAARTPAGKALRKSKEGFLPHEQNPRVLFEAGAEEMAAPVASFLSDAISTIEEVHGLPYLEPFRVYVCATQRCLNEFIGLPPGAPIRGTVRFGEVFLAPSAFDWQGQDLHKESLLHEMSHLHLRQHLGFVAARGRVPSWFHEGLADLASGVGGEGISTEAAVQAILNGPALQPDSTGNLWTLDRVTDHGLGGPMFHKQSRMFLTFLRDRDPEALQAFLLRLLREKAFAGPLRDEMGQGVEELWEEFKASLTTE